MVIEMRTFFLWALAGLAIGLIMVKLILPRIKPK